MVLNPNKYYAGDYFLDYAQSLCVIDSIAKVVGGYTAVRIKNIQTGVTYPFNLCNDKTKEHQIHTWLGQIDDKAARILYIKKHDAKKYVSFNSSDDVILEWKT